MTPRPNDPAPTLRDFVTLVVVVVAVATLFGAVLWQTDALAFLLRGAKP